MSRALSCAAICFAALGLTTSARAAACCTSATVFGVGRLLAWEDAAAGVNVGASRAFGNWDASGGWVPYGPAYSDGEGRAELWGLLRATEKAQLYLRLPWIVNARRSGALSELGQGLGDVQGGVRYEVLGIGELLELPSMAVTAGVLAPTGTRAEDAGTPLGTGGTGRGAWALSAAVESEYSFAPWYARLEVGGRYSLPFTREDLGVAQRYGLGLSAALSAGRALFSDRATAALLLVHEREGALVLGGEEVPRSGANVWSASAALSWRFHPHWSVVGALSSGLWADGLGANRPGRLGLTLGVRHGIF